MIAYHVLGFSKRSSCIRFRTSREGTPESPTMRTRTWPKGPTPFWSRPLPLLLRLPLSFQNIAAARTRRRRQKAPVVRSPDQASTRSTLIGAIRCDGKEGDDGTSAVEGWSGGFGHRQRRPGMAATAWRKTWISSPFVFRFKLIALYGYDWLAIKYVALGSWRTAYDSRNSQSRFLCPSDRSTCFFWF